MVKRKKQKVIPKIKVKRLSGCNILFGIFLVVVFGFLIALFYNSPHKTVSNQTIGHEIKKSGDKYIIPTCRRWAKLPIGVDLTTIQEKQFIDIVRTKMLELNTIFGHKIFEEQKGGALVFESVVQFSGDDSGVSGTSTFTCNDTHYIEHAIVRYTKFDAENVGKVLFPHEMLHAIGFSGHTQSWGLMWPGMNIRDINIPLDKLVTSEIHEWFNNNYKDKK